MRRAHLLRQLVLDSQYVIDEHLVAAAILARAATRRVLADASFRNDVRAPRAVRSFRPSTQARSFRPYVLRASLDRRRAPRLAGPV
jgi:hypothetical protein